VLRITAVLGPNFSLSVVGLDNQFGWNLGGEQDHILYFFPGDLLARCRSEERLKLVSGQQEQ